MLNLSIESIHEKDFPNISTKLFNKNEKLSKKLEEKTKEDLLKKETKILKLKEEFNKTKEELNKSQLSIEEDKDDVSETTKSYLERKANKLESFTKDNVNKCIKSKIKTLGGNLLKDPKALFEGFVKAA